MKNLKHYFVSIIALLLLSSFLFFSSSEKSVNTHYKLKFIFEKDLSKQVKADYIDLFGNEDQNFAINPYPFGPVYAKWYHVPKILYVDNSDNIYITIPGRIEIFDNKGNSIIKLYLPMDSIALDYYSWNNDYFYMFFKKHYEDTESEIFRFDVSTRSTKKLNADEIELLSPELRPPLSKKEMAQAKIYISSITDDKGMFYGLASSLGVEKLFLHDEERYIDPKKFIIFHFNSSLKRDYLGPLAEGEIKQYPEIYDKFTYDEIDIEKLFNDKVVCMGLGNSYLDKNGNLYLDGLKSSDAKRKMISSKMNSIEVKKPVFFLVKMENQ